MPVWKTAFVLKRNCMSRAFIGNRILKIAGKTVWIFIAAFHFATSSSGQLSYPDEQILISFKTREGKTVSLSSEMENRYIVFRIGTDIKTEMEFPRKTKESWQKFKYSSYLRGGGAENEGLDLNYGHL